MAHLVPGATTLEVYTNFLEITSLPTAEYYQYENIQPLGNTRGVQTKGRNYQVVARVQQDNAALFGPRPCYDGGSLLYSTRSIPRIDALDVCMGRRSNEPTHRVSIRKVATIDLRALQSLLGRRGPNDRTDPAAMPLNLLQLIVRQAPNLRHGFLPHARRFAANINSRDIGQGLSIWRAYFQSVRPALGRMLINVDRSSVPVYTPGPLLRLMEAFLGVRNTRDLQDLSREQFTKLRRHLKGVLIKITVSPNMRAKPIADLVLQAGLQEFDNREGERVTVRHHFENKYPNCHVVYPTIVGVQVGKGAIIPAEFCIVEPGQVFKRRLDPDVQAKFLQWATQRPQDRLRDIEKAIADGTFNYTDSDYIRDAGLTVRQSVLTVPGQIVPPPRVVFHNDNKEDFRRTAPGSWNLMHKKFFIPCDPLVTWGVACFGRVEQHKVESFVTKLVENFRRLGMRVPTSQPQIELLNASPVTVDSELTQFARKLMQAHRSSHPQLMLVLLPAYAAEIRREVKQWGDIKHNVPTQCVRAGKWDRFNDQYCNNVASKINERLGGVNSVIESPISPILERSMVVGADVGHPGPGVFHRPSITGLVASVDSHIVRLTSYACVQEPRVEMIQDLEQMMFDALGDYGGFNRDHPRPPNVIFYRDGLSEGEFERVGREEIRQIKKAFVRKGWVDPGSQPKLFFAIVGKRHNVRFFPQRGDGDPKSGNCPAGFLVDSHITNPNYIEFYLLGHSGLLGTSRPGHYTILENGPNFTMEEIYQISFHLCHTYASATRSVSIPAPVYYADKICQRLEFHTRNGASLSDTASNVTGAEPEPAFDLEYWKRNFRPSGLNKRKNFL